MAFQFCCPQGHVLQGEPSQVGQLFQCPMCGSSFLIPPPTTDPAATGGQSPAGGFFQGAGMWPAAGGPGPSFPAQSGMPGMMPPQSMPMMPGGLMPAGPIPAGPYPMPAAQTFAFGPAAVNPLAAGSAAAPASPPQSPPQPSATETPGETGKPRFDLGFDPSAKESLPFEIPGQSEADSGPAAPLPPPSLPPPSFPGSALPPTNFPAPAMPLPAFQPSAGGQDFLQSAPAAIEESTPPQNPPKVLHIRCPSGHVVKATSDLLGKTGRCPACKKTFELRYEDSLEFQRRTQKLLHREEVKTAKAWIAWALFAAFLVFAGLVALMLALSR